MQQRWYRAFVSIFSVLIIMIGAHYAGWLAPLEFLFAKSSVPVSRTLYGAQIYIYPDDTVGSLEELVTRYEESQRELLDLQTADARAEMLLAENDQLREQLHFLTTYGYEFVSADVIGRQIDPTESMLMINQGSQSGVEKDMTVIVGDGVLIGKVAVVEDTYAIVRLLNDTQSKIAATINNESKSIGILEGGFGISVQMNFIPQNERIQPGDRVITSGLSESVPRGLYIGTVETVEKEAYQPFQSAIVRPAVSFDRVSVVSIILAEKEL